MSCKRKGKSPGNM